MTTEEDGRGMTIERTGVASEGIFSGRHDRRKVTDWAYEEIRDAIIGLRLQPGDSLREAALAERLGVSKTPVREALGRLEKEGLVETTSFKGAVVSSYSREDLIEIYELRELLEGAAARTAADRSSTETVDRLRDIVERSRELRAAGTPLVDEHPRTGGMGTRIAFLHPSAFGGLLVELVEDGTGGSP